MLVIDFIKIILRARQNHLVEKYRSENPFLSSDILAYIQAAWRTYVRLRVAKGLPENEKPREGHEEEKWSSLEELVKNKEWKQDCLRRDEKFDMHFSSAVRNRVANETSWIDVSDRHEPD